MITMKINCTQHCASAEQLAAGVVDMPEPARSELIKLLTFEELPDSHEIHERASQICELVASTFADVEPKVLLLAGAPFLMSTLEIFATLRGWKPIYAFSKRVVIEELQADGSVKKTSVFKHEGFVEV